eukprot:jgi/Hompol1/3809/HPOL_006750-RA
MATLSAATPGLGKENAAIRTPGFGLAQTAGKKILVNDTAATGLKPKNVAGILLENKENTGQNKRLTAKAAGEGSAVLPSKPVLVLAS